MTTAVNQAETQLKLVEMDGQRLKDNRIYGSSQLTVLHFTNLGNLQCVCVCLEVMFEDVIAEPPLVWSLDKVWLPSHALLDAPRPVSLAAGLLFTALSCLYIWKDCCYTEVRLTYSFLPFFRSLEVFLFCCNNIDTEIKTL
uniref:Caveolin n=1 Tax=Seriola lalandi dorsalis TaxID=1841481 RepID=A0A3B4XAZ4_SERLL